MGTWHMNKDGIMVVYPICFYTYGSSECNAPFEGEGVNMVQECIGPVKG